MAEVAASHPNGAGAEEVEGAVERFLARDDVVAVASASGERRYTTASLLACERRIVDYAMRGQGLRYGRRLRQGRRRGARLAAHAAER